MFSINLSLLSHSNYIPDGHIVNLKQLSEDTVRIQIAPMNSRDSLPVVHSNSRKFSETHEDLITADMTMSRDNPEVWVKPKNFQALDNDKVSKKCRYNVLNTLTDIVRIIVKLNEMNVEPGYQLQNK